jgi:hypothetical protein
MKLHSLTISAALVLTAATVPDTAMAASTSPSLSLPKVLIGTQFERLDNTKFEGALYRCGRGGRRPRVPGGSGCDDLGDIVEHPECRR